MLTIIILTLGITCQTPNPVDYIGPPGQWTINVCGLVIRPYKSYLKGQILTIQPMPDPIFRDGFE